MKMSILLAFVLLAPSAIGGCSSHSGGTPAIPPSPSGVVNVDPASTQNAPIHVATSIVVSASEAYYANGFSASIITGEHCVNVTPVSGTSSRFSITKVTGCNSVVVTIVDDRGNETRVFLATM